MTSLLAGFLTLAPALMALPQMTDQDFAFHMTAGSEAVVLTSFSASGDVLSIQDGAVIEGKPDSFKPHCTLGLRARSLQIDSRLKITQVSASVDDTYYSGSIYLVFATGSPVEWLRCEGAEGRGSLHLGELKALLQPVLTLNAVSENHS